ncbi:MAG: hypothetical protein ACFFDT_37910 [Candidatus Hodarchaeota archaeon]
MRVIDSTMLLSGLNLILHEFGLIKKRHRKHMRKKDLSKIKKKCELFGQFSVDTKDLKDIPHYWPHIILEP